MQEQKMNKPELLLNRLDAIGKALSQKPSALALIGLGSVGIELSRIDAYSDLDFFVIVAAGSKNAYLQDLSWLTDIAPVAYYFQNTVDGFKLLYEDGIFCEFAVFEEAELARIPFAQGRIVWKAEGVDAGLAIPQNKGQRPQRQLTEWELGEALTNLYVGLLREQRGEKLSAMRFIQGYAVDRVLALAERVETAVSTIAIDPFTPERRIEQCYPQLAQQLDNMLQGYHKNRESALVIFAFLDEHFTINSAMKQAILALAMS